MTTSPIEYEIIAPGPLPDDATEHMVPMRDGVRLASDVYLSGDGARGPAILIRLPYDKDGVYTGIPWVARHMVARGYHVVAQDVRGKFRSEGVPVAFMNEVDDGYDAIDWITRQPWSNGSVVMWGDSYYGFTQWAAAASGHPALKAIAPRVTGTRLGDRPLVEPGQTHREVEYVHTMLYLTAWFLAAEAYDWEPDWQARPLIGELRRFQEQVGLTSPTFDLAYPVYGGDARFRGERVFRGPAIPVLHTIGWWDNCAHWSWADRRWISEDPEWSAHEYLLIDSIDHESLRFGNSLAGRERTVEEFREDLPEYVDPALDFFDAVLAGPSALAAVPRVRWNLAGTAGYRHDEAWPPRGAAARRLALTATGTLAEADAAVEEESVREWRHDPADLIPTSTPNAFAYLQYSPDDRALAERDDVAVFVGAPAERASTLAGPVSVEAVFSSEFDDAHLFARLYDRAPNGRLTRIALGQVHVLDARSAPTVTVDLGSIGYLLAEGHALQLHLQSSDYPEFLYSTGTPETAWEAVDTRPAQQRVALGGRTGAALIVHELDSVGAAHALDGTAL